MRTSSANKQQGVTTVEFSIVASVLLLLIFGIIEVARAVFVWESLAEATRRGARVAAVCPLNHSAIARIAVFNNASGGTSSSVVSGLETTMIDIDYVNDQGAVTPIFTQIRYVRVSIQNYQHQFLLPFLTQVIPAPEFVTTLPRESLGVTPSVATGTVCFGSAA